MDHNKILNLRGENPGDEEIKNLVLIIALILLNQI